jgi:hypothetical protein
MDFLLLTLIFSLLHDLGGFELDLDPNEGEGKLDLELLGCFLLFFLLFSYDFIYYFHSVCARSL